MTVFPFGQTLLLWRLERGLTQEALARKARIPRPNLSGIERGKREVSLRTLRALAIALGVRPGVLADGVAPGAAGRGPARLSRGALERIADAVARGSRLEDPWEQALARALRLLMAHRALASTKRWQKPRRSTRVAQRAWLQLEVSCRPEVIRSLVQRISERQGAA